MASRKRRYRKIEEDDKFETEAFEYLNENSEKQTSLPQETGEAESDVEIAASDESDREEADNLLDETERVSDDDAPETVGFATSKQTAMQQFRQAMNQIELEKKKKKEKRQKSDAQFKEQKSQKLKELSKTKLPQDLLESLDSEIPRKMKKPSKAKRKQKEAPEEEDFSGTPLYDSDMLDSSSLSKGIVSDYIPLSGKVDRASGVEVIKLGKEKAKTKSQAEIAAEFLKNRLYGGHIARETTKQKMAKEEKRKARFR